MSEHENLGEKYTDHPEGKVMYQKTQKRGNALDIPLEFENESVEGYVQGEEWTVEWLAV